MLTAALVALQVAASAGGIGQANVYSGKGGQLDVRAPKLEGTIAVDGLLDEAQWSQASILTGFSQFNPVDGRAAEDSTEVRIWYGADGMYFGIRAFAPAGTVRGTLADRDRIANDDHVMVILDTFNDRRRAFVFAVNPLGVQSDGIRSESGFSGFGGGRGGGAFTGGSFSRAGLTNADLNQDMLWQSKGRITAEGYEVEVRIPFKSLRYQATSVQSWGINVVRQTQRNNYQETWTPAKRGSASFLSQSGQLSGLRGMDRGLVLDVTPVATSFTRGSDEDGKWRYRTRQEAGGDVRWGVTPNMTLNATVNPDFSQVEADAGQIPGDVRFALAFAELRPFFVDGGEQFDAPGQLVYTRRIVQPVFATKLTGKLPNMDIGIMTALDGQEYSANGKDTPLFNIVRVRRDLGAQSNLGLVITDREEGKAFNRVVAFDGRIVHNREYTLAFQAGGSATGDGTDTRSAPLWEVSYDRTGRTQGFNYSLLGVHPDFQTTSGFVPRTDFVRPSVNQRLTRFGTRGAWLEQLQFFLSASALWPYKSFFRADPALEARLSLSNSLTIRGGWSVSVTPALETYAFDPRRYVSYRMERVSSGVVDTVPFVVGSRVSVARAQARISTPQFRHFGASLTTTFGGDANFLETSKARRLDVNAALDWRPTPRARVSGLFLHQEIRRAEDNSLLLATNIPRVRTEYQLSRAIFLRFVGQYENRERAALRDARSGRPLLQANSDGVFAPVAATASNTLRVDWLFSFLPSPGTVVYVGYGSSLSEDDAFSFQDVRRTSDGLFLKFSRLWRVG